MITVVAVLLAATVQYATQQCSEGSHTKPVTDVSEKLYCQSKLWHMLASQSWTSQDSAADHVQRRQHATAI